MEGSTRADAGVPAADECHGVVVGPPSDVGPVTPTTRGTRGFAGVTTTRSPADTPRRGVNVAAMRALGFANVPGSVGDATAGRVRNGAASDVASPDAATPVAASMAVDMATVIIVFPLADNTVDSFPVWSARSPRHVTRRAGYVSERESRLGWPVSAAHVVRLGGP
jgi:hypothetical protein